MATYVIGDLQGCFDALQRLLTKIEFNPKQDMLWFCGDLIARGPQSLECLNFVRSLGERAITVLGNHDLHFIACYYGFREVTKRDALQPLLQSEHLPQLVDFLCQQPLLFVSDDHSKALVHAGIAPEWQLKDALEACAEVQHLLQTSPKQLLSVMYGNTPIRWADATTDEQRWRFTINSCTRMRFCRPDGALELKQKGKPDAHAELLPWYEFWRNKPRPELFFGHWAALNGYSPVPGIHALDTGCVWGNSLTAYCIETQQRHSVAGLGATLYS